MAAPLDYGIEITHRTVEPDPEVRIGGIDTPPNQFYATQYTGIGQTDRFAKTISRSACIA